MSKLSLEILKRFTIEQIKIELDRRKMIKDTLQSLSIIKSSTEVKYEDHKILSTIPALNWIKEIFT